jgi:hypothetical protein
MIPYVVLDALFARFALSHVVQANNGKDYFISFDTVGQCLDGATVINTASYTVQALLSQTADGRIMVQSVAVTAGPSQQQLFSPAGGTTGANTRALDFGSNTRSVNLQVRANANSDGLSEVCTVWRVVRWCSSYVSPDSVLVSADSVAHFLIVNLPSL